jgi:hypothetical protein
MFLPVFNILLQSDGTIEEECISHRSTNCRPASQEWNGICGVDVEILLHLCEENKITRCGRARFKVFDNSQYQAYTTIPVFHGTKPHLHSAFAADTRWWS